MFQVYFCDINAEEGEKTRKEFADKYGQENIDFKSCDVANENNFKGMILSKLRNNYINPSPTRYGYDNIKNK